MSTAENETVTTLTISLQILIAT